MHTKKTEYALPPGHYELQLLHVTPNGERTRLTLTSLYADDVQQLIVHEEIDLLVADTMRVMRPGERSVELHLEARVTGHDEYMRVETCTCDPTHLEIGGYDRGCPAHDKETP